MRVNLYNLHFLSYYFSFQPNKIVFYYFTFPPLQPSNTRKKSNFFIPFPFYFLTIFYLLTKQILKSCLKKKKKKKLRDTLLILKKI